MTGEGIGCALSGQALVAARPEPLTLRLRHPVTPLHATHMVAVFVANSFDGVGATVLVAVKGRAQARAASGFIP